MNTSTKQYLHRRDEYQIPIALDMSREEIESISKSLLKKLGIKTGRQTLTTASVVHNARYGFDLMYTPLDGRHHFGTRDDFQEPRKIGFVTMDRFYLESDPSAQYQQAEIEVFPGDISIYRDYALEFEELLDHVRMAVGGAQNAQITRIPKYLQDN